ncbi:succinate-semialdehyde dehydrogenase (NAD(P)(+)) NDAI_0G01630 [Naumovozyma dairenensis CBS 421]|uniref:Succinate-semialdehyde dehydrogenase n=1 Tax=Naumovozyma dairenensis (strain ATCC 10597 / BCRC 20456 / CBS 421 / NBRC 0211 / NRRL Y-12639) TaxID=1071378 RepID=G0WDS8_NAUDC|nr:hypothetical protein NDAI_0G01630 [Naumovozyma dairenensis CBS 421]CCD25939.2 hypothetical protein NDAI_0G01630 [Naumovozyma dairenensis CBS 421]
MSTRKFPVPTFKNKDLISKSPLVDGEWLDPNNAKEYFEVTDPASNEIIAKMPEQTSANVEKAIDAAYRAFQTYRKTSPQERSKWLLNLYNLMIENKEDLAKLISWENGKSLEESRSEVQYAASYFQWFSQEATRVYGTTIQPSNPTSRVFTIRQPVGVCGIICPWNFPSAMITRKMAAALAVGCTVVIKPDSQTPLSALALGKLQEQAGFPKGVVNIILSHKNTPECGKTLCQSYRVKKVSFTGSTQVGKILMDQSSSTLKKLSFELGGNAPVIIFDDCDLDAAVNQTIASKFRGLGQTCVCSNRIYVHSSIIDKFADLLAEKVKKFVIGPGLEDGVTHGCIINGKAIEKIEYHANDAIKKGAKIVLKGGPLKDIGPNFYAPIILSHVPNNAVVSKEETFGPLCPIFKFDTLEEVVGYANDTELGLASYVFSKNVDTIYTVVEALEAGMVSCNTGIFSDAAIPFGGIKESGFGREGSLHGIEDYTVLKTITIGGLPPML